MEPGSLDATEVRGRESETKQPTACFFEKKVQAGIREIQKVSVQFKLCIASISEQVQHHHVLFHVPLNTANMARLLHQPGPC